MAAAIGGRGAQNRRAHAGTVASIRRASLALDQQGRGREYPGFSAGTAEASSKNGL
jgi:hypothetical protein